MTEDQAYVLGLFVGGGSINGSAFTINLPFKKWGLAPGVINSLSRNFAIDIKKRFIDAYGVDVDYNFTNDSWVIYPSTSALAKTDISKLISDLCQYGLPTSGFLLNTVDIANLKASISNYFAEFFISGLIDTRASVEGSHRRFNSNAPIVSLEVPGSTQNFTFVMQICSWLHDLGTYADQILYNHPSQHSPSDPYYSGWKKGFKIRFLAKDFLQQKSFSLQAKSAAAGRAAQRQTVEDQGPCEKRTLVGKVKPVCIHSDIASSSLPQDVRSRVFLHYTHVCALVGCPYAPLAELKQIVQKYNYHISVLPLLQKFCEAPTFSVAGKHRSPSPASTNTNVAINEAENNYYHLQSLYFPSSLTRRQAVIVDDLLKDKDYGVYNKLEEAVAFLFSRVLNGKRHVGNKDIIINDAKSQSIEILRTNNISKGEPILLINRSNDRAAMISSVESSFNQSLLNKIVGTHGLAIDVDPGFTL